MQGRNKREVAVANSQIRNQYPYCWGSSDIPVDLIQQAAT